MPGENDRYSRQMRFAGLGEEGQQKLRTGRVLLCGCGALGTVLAETLTRAGVGHLRIVDRDFVELSNLQRQVLFDENDVRSHLPKAIAAVEKLSVINSDVELEPVVADVDYTNVLSLADGAHLILDGTDNFEIRFLINDASLETGTPWIYAGCIGSHGQTMTVIPGRTACLRCLMEAVPEPGSSETCETAGILGPAVQVIAAWQAVDALKILSGQSHLIQPKLTIIDVWDGTYREMSTANLREQGSCPACRGGERVWLAGRKGSQSTVLCGRNGVQIAPQNKANLSLEELAAKLEGIGTVHRNPYLLRFTLSDPDCELTVFPDGRAIVKGTEDIGLARALYSRYIGS